MFFLHLLQYLVTSFMTCVSPLVSSIINTLLQSDIQEILFTFRILLINKSIVCFNVTRCSDEKNPRAKPYKFTTQKIKDLGLEFKPIKQSLYESVKSLQEKGHLPLPQDSNQNEVIIEP